DPPDAAVGAGDAVLLVVLTDHLLGHRGLHDARAVVRVNGIQPGSGRSIETIARASPDFLITGTDVQNLILLRIAEPKDFADVLRQLAKHFATLSHGVLVAAPFRDVPEHDHRAH